MFATRRSRVQVPRFPPGAVAQLGMHLLCKQAIAGSSPARSTKIVSSVARASGLHPESRGFESLTIYQPLLIG